MQWCGADGAGSKGEVTTANRLVSQIIRPVETRARLLDQIRQTVSPLLMLSIDMAGWVLIV